jgi:hypothetical protein
MTLRSYYTLSSPLSIAIPYAPILSTDETKLFVATSIPIFYALEAETGVIEWSFTGEADTSASAKVSPDDAFVYLTWVSFFRELVMECSNTTSIHAHGCFRTLGGRKSHGFEPSRWNHQVVNRLHGHRRRTRDCLCGCD